MNTAEFEVPDGWREVDAKDAPGRGYLYLNLDGQDRYWVPIVELPTEAFTVIRAEVHRNHVITTQTLVHMGGSQPWRGVSLGGDVRTEDIVGFEVLARPAAESGGISLDRNQIDLVLGWGDTERDRFGLDSDERVLIALLKEAQDA